MEHQSAKDEDQPIAFVRKHRFKDTLALFIVFLSFNHFASLCLLISFVIATRFRNFLANSFITLFLSKKPSPGMNEISHREAEPKKSRTAGFQTPVSLLSCEILVATVLKLYAESYFLSPIENLALSILASSLINDPSDCLSYATSCSVLYAITLNICRKLGPLSQFTETWGNCGEFCYSSIPLWRPEKYLRFREGSAMIGWLDKYVHHLLYYISFHIVVFQFSQSILNPNYYEYESRHTKKAVTNKMEVSRNNQRISSSGSLKPQQQASGGVNGAGTTGSVGLQASGVNNTDKSNVYASGFAPHELGAVNYNGSANGATQSSSCLIKKTSSKSVFPYFTSVVRQYKVYEPSVISAAGSNSQTISTNVTMRDPDSLREDSYTNQFYEMKVNFDHVAETRNLKTDVSITSNLENFIYHLFKRKNQHLIAPLWSMVVTLKTINFEKKHLKESKEVNMDASVPVTSGAPIQHGDSESSESITPTNSNSSVSHEKNSQSVFNKLQAREAMALIAQTAFDDYAQLHLVSSKDNIFENDTRDYKVCMVEISTNSITFHIENLHEGELIVLVNGVIWSEVSCALILDCEGEELVVVGGLVPACSYDIQFINRLNRLNDYLISDLMIRTAGNKEQSEKFENIDFSFPSYYHRKFLSPLLTLKHSVLTTNTNLAESRAKLKKTKKEISKKLSTLRQDIDHYKSKISQNASNDGKNAAKVDSLKIALQYNEGTLSKLESELKRLTEREIEIEQGYLKQKDLHLRRQMDHGKLKESLDSELNNLKSRHQKLQQELGQLSYKKEKLCMKHERLQREVDQTAEEFEAFKREFLAKKQSERSKRQEIRAREANEFEMTIKGLEQDISRLEGENGSMHKIMHGF
ncbi:NNF2 (YGR089W) [Zygosaccharomyces parabailii]|nr:NNF2 (YGR089W) [Zygosaccharomyces parabailii]CDH12440.1 related to Protein NNF2 [Zygosaccharomyces bailii ISA1307]